MKNRRYINSYASTAAIINLQNQIDDIKAGGGGGSGEGGDTSALEARVTTIENSLKNYATADALDTAIAGVEGQVDAVEATVSDKLGVDDVAVWAKSEDPTLIPVNKLDDHAVKYSDFEYTPSGESSPVTRKTIQLANYDSISGMNVAGNDAANLIMMSKWDKVDIGSSRYPVNLNGSEFTLNDEKHIATIDQIPEVIEFAGLTDLETGAASASIQTAIGLEFADLVETIGHNKAIFMDRNAAGDYKTCIHATGNISGGNGGANLMFMVGTVPTVYEIQYVNNEWALYVAEYEFAKKSDIPSLDGYATTQNVSDSIAAEASARDKAIETATSDLVHNTLTVAGKSLTENITLASTDLTDGADLVKTSDIPTDYVPNTRTVAGKALNADVTLYAADIKEKENSADTVYDLMPKIISCPIDARVVKDSYTVAEIFNMFGGATTMTEVRVFADRGVNYLRMANSIGSYQNYMLPVNYYQIPNGTGTTGTIKLIGIGPDPDNKDLITKFTITMTLNGDASTIAIDTKALEA